jgi:hypothetical protein
LAHKLGPFKGGSCRGGLGDLVPKARIQAGRSVPSDEVSYNLLMASAMVDHTGSCNRFTSISGQDTSQPLPYDPSSTVEVQIRSSFATSLRQLRTTYLDSYILHSPLETYAKTLRAWRILVALQDEGCVRAIGLSNAYDPTLFARLGEDSGRAIQVVQNRWYERNGWDREVVKWCHANSAQYQ